MLKKKPQCRHFEIRFGWTNRTEAQCFYPAQRKMTQHSQQQNWARKPVKLCFYYRSKYIFVFRVLSQKKILLIGSPPISSSFSVCLCITMPQLLFVCNRTFLLEVGVSCNIKLTDLSTRYVSEKKQLSNYTMKFYLALQFIPQTVEWRNELILSCINLDGVKVVYVDMLGSRVGTRRTIWDARNYITPGLKRLTSLTRLAVDSLQIYTTNIYGRTFYIWSESMEYLWVLNIRLKWALRCTDMQGMLRCASM
jgi:hypothetical protein